MSSWLAWTVKRVGVRDPEVVGSSLVQTIFLTNQFYNYQHLANLAPQLSEMTISCF
jgi:hypothetical protein